MSDEKPDNTTILPCGHTAREHAYIVLANKLTKFAFLVGVVVGGIIGIVSMMVFS